MAITYIKLGPIGDAFASKELGLYLNLNNASEIDVSILNNRLVNFTLTGFLVEISKLEYDNIKLKNQLTSNIPLNSVPIGQPNILEPVESIVGIPPENTLNIRYLVGVASPGIFLSKKDYIAQSDGIDWVYTKPLNGMILPVYDIGISVHYTGTYPSGHWDIPQDVLDGLGDQTVTGDNTDWDALNLALQQEIKDRISGDKILQGEIDALIKATPTKVKASDVSITDTSNYYESTNVEGALKEIGGRFVTDEIIINQLQTALDSINSTGIAFQFLFGTVIPDDIDGNLNNVYLDSSALKLYKKIGTTDEDAHWTEIADFNTGGSSVDPENIGIPAGSTWPIFLDIADYLEMDHLSILEFYIPKRDVVTELIIPNRLQRSFSIYDELVYTDIGDPTSFLGWWIYGITNDNTVTSEDMIIRIHKG